MSSTAAIQLEQKVDSAVVHLDSKENNEAEIPLIYQIIQLSEFVRKLKLMVDSASSISFVNLLTWHDLECPKLLPTSRILRAFESQSIHPVGYFKASKQSYGQRSCVSCLAVVVVRVE